MESALFAIRTFVPILWFIFVMSAIMDRIKVAVSFVEALGWVMPITVKNVP